MLLLDTCPFCDPAKTLVYFSNRPTVEELQQLVREGEEQVVRIDDIKLLRAMLESVEVYKQRIQDALAAPVPNIKLLQQLIQAGKALEIETHLVPALFSKVLELASEQWRKRAL